MTRPSDTGSRRGGGFQQVPPVPPPGWPAPPSGPGWSEPPSGPSWSVPPSGPGWSEPAPHRPAAQRDWSVPTPGAGPWQDTGGAPAPLGGQLHAAAIGVWSAGQISALAVILLLNPGFMVVALPLLAVSVAVSAVRYARFRWRLEGPTLVIEQGLVQRQRRVIPVERVQSVDLVRRLSHRLFRVVAVHVEAIGAGDTEGRLDALAPDVAHRLRETLLARRAAARGDTGPVAVAAAGVAAESGPAPAATGGEMLVHLGPRQLLLGGLTEANATLLAAAGGLAWQFLGERIDEFLERAPALLGTSTVVVAVLVGLVAAVLLLVAAQFVLYWDFRLQRSGAELHVRRGLLEQRFDTIPLRRLQALRVEENLPRRLLGFAAVKADVAGKPGGGSGGTDTLLPFGRASEARRLVATILDDERAAEVALQPMPRRARARRMVRAGLFTLVATAAATAVWGTAGLPAVLVAVPAFAAAEASYRALGHAELPGLVVVRSGWWVRRTAFVPESRLQTLALTASVLQRWRDLATLELHIARSPGLWSGPQMIDLDRELGRDLVRDLAPVLARRPGTT